MNESANKPDYRVLMTGDLHLGRSSSRVPAGLSANAHCTTSAWERIAQLAIGERVDAVLLAGDIADEQNKFWEALGALETGIKRLTENNIQTVAVASGDDIETLTKLAAQSRGNFTLLGRKGQWERMTLENSSGPVLHLEGWSGQARHAERSPLDDYQFSSDSNIPSLGLIHGNFDVPDAACWLVGGPHQSRLAEDSPWILHPGSPQALHPDETGVHGPWIAEIRNGRIETPTQTPLATVRFESLVIDATGIVAEEDLRSEIKDALRAHGERIIGTGGGPLEQLIFRLTISGQSNLAGSMKESLDQIESDFRMNIGTVTLTVDQACSDLLPEIDLQKHARQNSILGTVASLLLELDQETRSEAVEDLIEETRRELAQVGARPDFLALPDAAPATDEVVAHLRRTGRDLLVQLLQQTHA